MRNDETLLYKLYDKDDALLYIGITARLEYRLPAHRRNREWGERISKIRTRKYKTEYLARVAEREACLKHQPLFNKRGKTYVEEKVSVTARIPKSLCEKLEKMVRERNITKTQFLSRLVEEKLKECGV